jgi:aldehyde dehydrogenase (NAD+)
MDMHMDSRELKALFELFGIAADNPARARARQWRGGGERIASINPANAQPLAHVTLTSADDLAAVIASPRRPRVHWRDVPAPRRGEAVRRFGNLLREHKDALGTLVSLENGKIKAEGDGEVQEMIDIADFAVGQSRMLYGKSMHSERAAHRMYEQWHPLGVVGVISAFNFPSLSGHGTRCSPRSAAMPPSGSLRRRHRSPRWRCSRSRIA